MRASMLFAASALAACALTMGACNKTPAANSAADAANNAAATSNPAAAAAEDTTAAAVGAASAATTLTAAGFVTAAATSDMYEVAAAKIAAAKATSPDVKKFAQQMIHDHTASTAKLKALLAGGAVAAAPPGDMDKRRKGLINNLNMAQAPDFDKTYMDQQVAAHQEAITLFKGYTDHGDNDALKGFTTAVTPTIQAHLDMAKQIRGAMK